MKTAAVKASTNEPALCRDVKGY